LNEVCDKKKEKVERRVAHVARPQKAHQQRELVHPTKGKV